MWYYAGKKRVFVRKIFNFKASQTGLFPKKWSTSSILEIPIFQSFQQTRIIASFFFFSIFPEKVPPPPYPPTPVRDHFVVGPRLFFLFLHLINGWSVDRGGKANINEDSVDVWRNVVLVLLFRQPRVHVCFCLEPVGRFWAGREPPCGWAELRPRKLFYFYFGKGGLPRSNLRIQSRVYLC